MENKWVTLVAVVFYDIYTVTSIWRCWVDKSQVFWVYFWQWCTKILREADHYLEGQFWLLMKICQVSDYIYMSPPKICRCFNIYVFHSSSDITWPFYFVEKIHWSHFIYKALALHKTLTICYFVEFLPLQFCKALWADILSFLFSIFLLCQNI